jgi:hypothetical protein
MLRMPLTRSSANDTRQTANMTCQASGSETTCQASVPPINALAKDILRHLDEHIDVPTLACPGLEDHETIDSERLADIRTRFLLWTGNLGVMHKPEDPRALDRRLIDAPEVAGRVREILADLQDLLSQRKSTRFGSHVAQALKTNRREVKRPCNCITTQNHSTQEAPSMDEEEAMMMQLLGLQTSRSCTTSWLSASIDDTLRRLFHLSSLITKSSTRDKFVRARMKHRLEMYEPYDVQHVQEKVRYANGRADESLMIRMGKANTSRRQFIVYSREHNDELSRTNQKDDTSSDQDRAKRGYNDTSDEISVGRTILRSEMTKQSAAPTKASTVGLFNPDVFDYGLDDARSCTTVATSIVDGQALSGLKVPELTQYATPGEHFICPLCQTVQRFNGQTTWR